MNKSHRNSKISMFVNRLKNYLPEFLLVLFGLLVLFPNLNNDFWNDEIYTLKEFTQVPILKTLTDYHVPNNHIFFNLINNIYLKIIGIDSLYALMDFPYVLRIIPLAYALLSIVFFYKTVLLLADKYLASIAVILLVTTIPFHFFALQIRGYGLSLFLLVAITYLIFRYLHQNRKRQLYFIAILTVFLIYTIPSNLYFAACIIAYFSLGYIFNLIKRNKNTVDNLYIVLAVVTGCLVAAVLYLPNFNDVTANKYVTGGEGFNFTNLTWYLKSLTTSFISGRWWLIIPFGLGFLLNFKNIKKETYSYSLILFLLPLSIIFIRGEAAPLRVFVVILPFIILLFAIGIYSFWKLFFKTDSRYNLILVAILLVYSLVIFKMELSQVDKKLYNDLLHNGRSQDLYYQYYSKHYQPLKDIADFNLLRDKNIPVVIIGCEPHGVGNYLGKFDIPYLTSDTREILDSLLTTNDSAYIVTNHPKPFLKKGIYKSELLKEQLTYHNILLYFKNPAIPDLQKDIEELILKYRDSLGIIIQGDFAYTIFDTQSNNFYFLQNENKESFADFIEFTDTYPYNLYFEPYDESSLIHKSIAEYEHTLVMEKEYNNLGMLYLFESGVTLANKHLLYHNDFDTLPLDNKIETKIFYSPPKSEKLDSANIYSSGFHTVFDTICPQLNILVSFYGKFRYDTKSVVVLEVNRTEKDNIWIGNKIDQYHNKTQGWQKVITVFQVNDTINKGDNMKLYLWNANKETFYIDELKIFRLP